MGHFELAGTRSSLAPLQQVFPVARVLHDAGVSVPVGHIDIAIRREGHIRRQVEVVWTYAGDSFTPKLHDCLPLGIHFVDHVTGGVDRPDVALRIHTHRVRAAGSASSRPIDGRVA